MKSASRRPSAAVISATRARNGMLVHRSRRLDQLRIAEPPGAQRRAADNMASAVRLAQIGFVSQIHLH